MTRKILALGLLLGLFSRPLAGGREAVYPVWQMIELSFASEGTYANPYAEVDLWIELKGPSSTKRCYGVWDGGNRFLVRLVATEPGQWSWISRSMPNDTGLDGKTGSFEATAWTEQEKADNPVRRGFIRATPNGHALQYADGTPFFLLGDTWWPAPTFRYRWHDDDKGRPIGPGMGFKDAVRFRKAQGFNCIAMIAAFPHWANDGKPARFSTGDGTLVRSAWPQAGTQSAKDMHDENGNRAFLFPGKVPGLENIVPDLDRINPEYFTMMDKKIAYLNSQGIIPFIEPARRDIGAIWKKYHKWPDSYARYIHYIWSRYGAYNVILSPIHLDYLAQTFLASDWNDAANMVIDRYGPPPFGNMVTLNSPGSSLRTFGHTDKARWITMHQVGNQREHAYYPWLTEIFWMKPPIPCLNGEPYYDGYQPNLAEGGTELSALYARSGMYGSVLSGGLAGHIHGAQGLWAGEVEPASNPALWEAIRWPAAAQMQHLRTVVLSEDKRYQDLEPARELLVPNQSGGEMGYLGWAYCARTADKRFVLLYFERDCPKAVLSGLIPNAVYSALWFNPRTGQWSAAGEGTLTADSKGKISLPDFPGGQVRSSEDWAMKLTAAVSATPKLR